MASSSSSSRSCKYDLFLSFRGEDTRKTFVDHLYSTLKQHLIRVYKDDVALPRGEFINESLFEAIEESQIAVIIFSKNYADSSWCLDELAHIMKCKNERDLIVIPIFYDVEPTEVRNQNGKFGEAFAKQETKNVTKTKVWRKALADMSSIAGWEPKNIANGHESQFIKNVVDTILDRLFPLNSFVDEDLVGMRARFKDLKSLLDVGSGGVRMVGIWGVGGGGKTTLASSIYMDIFQHFQGHCIIENVREETSKYGLNKLQENILSALFKEEVKVHSIVEGKHKMKTMLCHRSVLVVLDDIDKLDQLEALAGKHNWFGSGSRIIITTRDEHLLRTHKVDHVYPVKLLSRFEATRLFKKHAYNEEDPVEDYETLSSNVVSYCAGLPLAIKVLGSFLYDKNKTEWTSAMDKLKDIPDLKVTDMLKISFDGLEACQKQLFLDIACFFRRRDTSDAMEVFEACGYHPKIGVKVLMQKALITINVDGEFDMHDLVQEMGHYIARGEHRNNPEKHSRLWNHKDIEGLPLSDETMEFDKIEAIVVLDGHHDSSRFCKIVSNMKNLRLLIVCLDYYDDENTDDEETMVPVVNFLSNELLYMIWSYYPAASPFPHKFQPMKLVVLKLSQSMQKEVWKGYKHLPCLRELDLSYIVTSLSQLTRLKSLDLSYCDQLFELPELPSSLAILKARGCKSLTVVEDFNKDCTELCEVTLCKYEWTDRLLQSMLKGKAIENGCMRLRLDSLEIPKGFTSPLIRRRSCRLELPENWCNDFSGFLICSGFSVLHHELFNFWISMKHVSGMDLEDDVVLEEHHYYGDTICVWYVSFGSLRHTTWWDQTYKYLEFHMDGYFSATGEGLQVKLVDKGSTSGGLTETSTSCSSPYTPKFEITHDSLSELKANLVPYSDLVPYSGDDLLMGE